MSTKKLTITDTTGKINGLTCNVRYEKMDRDEPPKIVHKVDNEIVAFKTMHDGKILLEGMTKKVWADEKGKTYAKEEVKHYYEEDEVTEKGQTKIFEIIGFQPLSAYTDSYVLDKYYELSADEDGHTKDFDKNIARRKNTVGMRILWEYLHQNKVVARGEFNVSSSGFLATDGYIRAVSFGNKWGLEVGIFKEEKIFHHLQEGIPEAPKSETKITRLKRV